MRSLRSFILAAGCTTLVLACGGDHRGPTEPPPPPPPTLGMKIVGGGGATDTIGAPVPQALTVEVRDSAGKLATGTVVRFTSLPSKVVNNTPSYGVLVTAIDQNQYTNFAAPTVDPSGRAAVLVQLGLVAGPARIEISVPTLGLVDTVSYTVQPGAAARLASSFSDTVLAVGATTPLGVTIVDRGGNPRSDPVTYDPPTPATGASVSASGVVTALDVGHVTITAHVAGQSTTAAIEVVPAGQLAVYTPGTTELGVVNFDGTGYQKIGTLSGYDGYGLTWAGSKIEYGANGRIQVIDASGGATPMTSTALAAGTSESWPEYSAAAKATFYTFYSSSQWRVYRHGDDGTIAEVPAEPAGALEWRSTVSPDGTKVAYITVANSAASIKVFDMTAGATSAWAVPGQVPRWSPAGNQIAFVQPQGGPIQVMNADGSNVRTLTSARYPESRVDWSPDGKWILAKSTTGSVDLVNAQTGATISLAYLSKYTSPAWKR